MTEENPLPGNAIAVVGMAVRVPGARTLDGFWQNLRAGVESIRTFTDEELLAAGVPAEELAQPGYVRAFGALDDVAGFDAELFGVTPREAALLDPQHRVFLECAWEALEHAGYLADANSDDADTPVIGVYGGIGAGAYHVQNILPNADVVARHGAIPIAIANDKDFVLTRVSYKLDLSGPSMSVQTACSTSLVAVHLACQALGNGDCDVALAGGARVLLPAHRGYRFEPDGVVSPDGRCRAFDADAAGTVPGNGAGVVALKRLDDALADGDVVHAVIRGSAINNDGARKVGFTAPSVAGQADVIAEALAVAEVEPEDVTYVETHGTGTPLGDSIELTALSSVFGDGALCAIGSVKTNLGHLDAAAGVVGLVKTVLALRARELPPTLHLTTPHPLADGRFHVTTALTPWQAETLRAGVSSFGIGGTNAHVVVEEPPLRVSTSDTGERARVLPLSAATPAALAATRARLADHLRAHPDEHLADVACTLQRGRRTLPHRHFVVARTVAEAVAALDGPAPEHHTAHETARDRDVVFLFPGQGTQRIGMGQALYRDEPVYRAAFDRVADLLEPVLGADMRRLLDPAPDDRDAARERLTSTRYAQPALFAVEYALARLWQAWGVRPAAMLGHSVGELVAACLAGVMSLEDAVTLVAARGRLMQNAPGGAMLAASMSEADLMAFLAEAGADVDLAAVNGPHQCVVSGTPDAVEAVAAALAARGVETRRLVTSHAFHSRLMDDAADAFEVEVARITLAPPTLPFVSNVTGTWITDEQATSPRYWARQLRAAVRFADGVRTARAVGGALLEVGPGDVLTRLGRTDAKDHPAVASLPSIGADGHDATTDVLTAAGLLWSRGVSVRWAALDGATTPRRTVLPTYPFERERFWIDPPRAGELAQARAEGLAVRGFRRVGPAVPGPAEGVWLVVTDPAGTLDGLGRAVPAQADPALLLALAPGERVAGVVHGDLPGVDDPLVWLLGLERALAARGDDQARVVAVVSGALEVTGAEPLVPALAALSAWAGERPGVRALIDVDGAVRTGQLAAEVRNRADGPVVALRGRHRFVPSPAPLRTAPTTVDRHSGAHYALTGEPRAVAAFRAALSQTGATVTGPEEPSSVAVVVLDADAPDTDIPVPPGVDAYEVHVLSAGTAAAEVVAARVSLLQRDSDLPWTVYLWPGGVETVDRTAADVVGLAPGAGHVVVPPADADEPVAAEVTPRDDLEATIAAIFEDLLGVPVDGHATGFFELGGDSLLAVKLLADVRRACGVAPPMRAVVDDLTVRGIARAVRAARAEDTGPETLPSVVADPRHATVPFPLTELQQAFWVGRAGVYEIGDVGMHLYEEFDVPDLDVARLERAVRVLVRRHGMLRMIVLPHGEQQILDEVPDYVVETEDVSGLPAAAAEAALERTRTAMSHQVFAPERWPLFDIRATVVAGRRARLHFSIDGLVTDAWAIRILKRDLARLYHDPDLELPELELSFRDYLLAERSIASTELYRRAERYWLERVPTMALAPDLPLACDPGTIDVARFRKVSGTLPAESWARIRAWAARRDLTPTSVLLAAWSEVVATWAKERRFTLNLPTANRLPLHPQVDEIIGDFTSVTLVEVDAAADTPFEARARAVRDRLVSDLDHRFFSGVRVQRALRKERGDMAATMPVVFTCVLHDEAEDERLGEVVYGISQTPQIWLDTQVYETGGALALDIDAVDGLFPDGMVAAMHGAAMDLLRWLAEDETRWHGPLPSLTPRADLVARAAYNRTEGPIPAGLLHQPFFATAARTPDRPAVITPDRTVGYGELAARAHGIAARLARAGAGPNELVAVAMEKGWEQCAAVLGVLAAGAAYLPIDPDLPDERIRYLLGHARTRVVLTQARVLAAGPDRFGDDRTVLAVDELPADGTGGAGLDVGTTPDDLAYVIFTSGSTGVPKGVMINHRGALNTVADVNERFGVGADDRVLALSSLSFDLSVYDVFGPLAVGGAIVMPAASAHRDPAAWLDAMTTARVTLWNSVPALMELFLEHLEVAGRDADTALRLVMMSGDWIPVALPDRSRRFLGAPEIVSLGGATEASIWSILYPIGTVPPEWTSIPYGVPMRNQTFHVLDDAFRPRPVWVPGQLYIGGVGLADGYLRDEEKTAASFVVHPETGERLYRTGDLGRFLPGGVIEFLGREDFQVKIQGNRIELGEIEAAILQHPEVRNAVVVVHGPRHGSKRLVGFVAPAVPAGLDEFLAAKLPRYMVPVAYQELTAVPLTANGKVDRQALVVADDVVEDDTQAHVAPRSPVEEVVAEVWTKILGVDRVGVHDNFFTLGGDSLMAMRAVVHLREALDIELPMRVLFDSPTLADVAVVVEDQLVTEIENMSEDDARSSLSG